MSGIVGIINLDGAPVEPELLKRMTDFMAFRGPDAQEIWVDGNVGFGHTMLRTTWEAETEKQPLTLDGKVWLTADARIDGRTELIAELEAKLRRRLWMRGSGNGSGPERLPNDAELILLAYEAWSQDCVKHLIGDFAFAICDARERQLFCARDHFGVKPFYYASVGNAFIFSNTLNCVRQHPAVSDELNDLAIADFLLFDGNQDPATTTFSDIARLPPAHYLTRSASGLRLQRYWILPLDHQIQYRRKSDQIAHFRELLRTAVADRMRTNHIGITMSGGLDSTAVAATASELLKDTFKPSDLTAYSTVWDNLIPDQERYYSGVAGKRLGIPIHYLAADNYRLFEGWERPELRRPEPVNEPHLAIFTDQSRCLSDQCRVSLTGWDGDAILNESPKPYFRFLLRRFRLTRLLFEISRYMVSQRRVVPLTLSEQVKRLFRTNLSLQKPTYPTWLNQAFEKRLALPDRWKQINDSLSSKHPIRPYAHRVLSSLPNWLSLFEGYDSGVSLLPIEYRHPLIDLRIIDCSLSLPPAPWCVKKELLRASMEGLLPNEVRLRPKTPLAGLPYLELLGQACTKWVDDFHPTLVLGKYVDSRTIGNVFGEKDPWKAWINLRPLSLNYWFQHLESDNNKLQNGDCA
jgi:asparagine synthase (glutamine-hydrolysing)